MGHFQKQEGTEVVSITGIGSSGEGVGSLDGLRVFVDGTLPDETARVKLTQRRQTYAKGRLLEILDPSPHRINPVCPLFGRCGGCQLMHMDAAAQLEVKRQRVVDALQRIGGLELAVAPCRPSPHALGYRNKIQMPVVDGRVGLYARRTNQIVPVDQCFIHCALGEEILDHLRPLITDLGLRTLILRTAIQRKEALVVLVTRGMGDLIVRGEQMLRAHPSIRGVAQNVNTSPSSTILGDRWRQLAGDDSICEELSGLTLRLSPASFMQVNTLQAEQLYAEAIQNADIEPGARVADLYCGIGALSLLAARKGAAVTGVEIVPAAIANARHNAQLNRLHAEFICGAAEAVLERLGPLDAAFLNPPRKGCDRGLLEALRAPRLVYISCDPATLARDLKTLSRNGYRVQQVTPFDMFPQTAHVEVVCSLTRL